MRLSANSAGQMRSSKDMFGMESRPRALMRGDSGSLVGLSWDSGASPGERLSSSRSTGE